MTIPSPCNGICTIDPASGLCRGCLRTLDEIAGWGSASDARRRSVLAQIARRRSDDGPKP